ncbi:TIGR04540 family protein [Bacillaceae bacterium CLA-AA-H227]|uniref:TIGR04540 family protein n=1 Tax=Robertmurraya yapensis (ex Hitch et al 2024) TaxID=3133160 RepID=A0ACC6SHI1_9BACI
MVFLQFKLFYKTQRELALSLNGIVDAYWNNELNEDTLFRSVNEVYINNPNKILKDGAFTTVLKQQCGKRRLEVIERIINSNTGMSS